MAVASGVEVGGISVGVDVGRICSDGEQAVNPARSASRIVSKIVRRIASLIA